MSQDLKTLRDELFATLRAVKDGTMELDRARQFNEISKTIVDTGKLEVDYIRAMQGEGHSEFIQPPKASSHNLPAEQMTGIKSITRHVLEG